MATTEFAALAREAGQAQGLANARIATVAHPVGGIDETALLTRAEGLVDAVLALLTPETR